MSITYLHMGMLAAARFLLLVHSSIRPITLLKQQVYKINGGVRVVSDAAAISVFLPLMELKILG